jgi:hypothetical protein
MASNKSKLFDRVYDRCACLQAGQTAELSEAGEALLLRAIRSFEERVDRPWREREKARMAPHVRARILQAQLEREQREQQVQP